jgi:hypothetical protein
MPRLKQSHDLPLSAAQVSPMSPEAAPICRVCGDALTASNWTTARRRTNSRTCKRCGGAKARAYSRVRNRPERHKYKLKYDDPVSLAVYNAEVERLTRKYELEPPPKPPLPPFSGSRRVRK